MRKQKPLFALLTFTLMGTLMFWLVSATSTIQVIKAPNANWYQGLMFDDGNWNVVKLLDRNLWAETTWYNCTSYYFSCNEDYRSKNWFGTKQECDSFINQSYRSWMWYSSENECIEALGNGSICSQSYVEWSGLRWYCNDWNSYYYDNNWHYQNVNYQECIAKQEIETNYLVECMKSNWYYYQRWNNHGFWLVKECNTGEIASNMSRSSYSALNMGWCFYNINTSTWSYNEKQIDASAYWPENYYSWDIFIINENLGNNGDWSIIKNDNLRWWSWDNEWNLWWLISETPITDRQWPCPRWYHIPSAWEWNNLFVHRYNSEVSLWWWDLSTWVLQWKYENWSIDWEDDSLWIKFWRDFLIPFAGFLNFDSSINISPEYGYAHLWTSSPHLEANWYSWVLNFNRKWRLYQDKDYRAYGFSVRCFYDYYYVNFFDGEELILTKPVYYWDTVNSVKPADPEKSGYKFLWWYNNVELSWENFDFGVEISEKLNLYAKWEKNNTNTKPTTSWWWGWGGWSSRIKDNCPNGDYSDSYYDGTCWTKPQDSSSQTPENNEQISQNNEWNNELQTAYEFAYRNWITTMDSIQKANMEWNLTRIAMAKMLSQYAINILWMEPDESRIAEFSDVDENLDSEYDDWVTLAYQLWIMWINMPDDRFRPFDLVPRSEFVTALSRMKYGTPDGKEKYYSTHMELLNKLWIITVTDPDMKELRWYVMLMLMRSEK